jgi:hypothetical protein
MVLMQTSRIMLVDRNAVNINSAVVFCARMIWVSVEWVHGIDKFELLWKYCDI